MVDAAEHAPDESNDLLRWLTGLGHWLGRHWPIVALPVAAVAVGWGMWSWKAAAAATESADGWRMLREGGIDDLAKKAGAVPAARYAQLRLAERALDEGRSSFLSDRDGALAKFKAAADLYDAIAADGSAAANLRHAAMFGKGVALECQLAPEKAAEQYKKLVAAPGLLEMDRRNAEARMKDLNRKSTQDFFRELAAAKNLAPPAAPAVAPGLPDFGANPLGGLLDLPPPPKPPAAGRIEPPPPVPPLPDDPLPAAKAPADPAPAKAAPAKAPDPPAPTPAGKKG